MNIFMGFKEIAGNYESLKKGFQRLGVNVFFLDLAQHKYCYNKDNSCKNFWLRLLLFIAKNRRGINNCKFFYKTAFVLLEQLARIPLFVWCLINFDVYLFSYAESFFYFHLDLPILKFFNKKIIFQFHGSDVRPPYSDGALVSNITSTKCCVTMTHKQKKKIKRIEKYADVIISGVTYSNLQEKKFIDVLFVGKPVVAPLNTEDNKDNKCKDSLKVLHAPSNLIAKGTLEIRAVINKLKEAGYKIEYVELFNVNNAEVIKEIQTCDFIIDQLYSDIYMSSFSKEAAAYKKPTLVGGYFNGAYDNDAFINKIPPVCLCLPEDLEKACKKMIGDEIFRKKLGLDAYDFVINNWTCEKVAQKYLSIINNDFSGMCFSNPSENTYIYGACMSKFFFVDLVARIFKKNGLNAFRVNDKPQIQKALKEVINNGL